MVNKIDFRKWANSHPNFMSPHILKVGQVGNTFIELSKGTGLSEKPIYGVSVIQYKNGSFRTNTDYGKPFQSKRLAEQYFNKLSRMKW